MTQYVALLRGVNVGKITVKSADLADMARGLGLDDVRTVLATGNLTFTSSGEGRALKYQIEGGLCEAGSATTCGSCSPRPTTCDR